MIRTNYFLVIKLFAEYNEKNIYYLFQKGEQLNFRYSLKDNILNPIQAGDKILNANKKNLGKAMLDFSWESPSVHIFLQNLDFMLSVYCFDNFIKISISDLYLEKKFPNSKSDYININFPPYIHCILKLCEDFNILELKTDVWLDI